MKRRLPLLLAVATGLLVTAVAPRAVLASCAPPPPLEQSLREATTIFVGTVARTSNGDRWADVVVEEIWKGPDLPPLVLVRGGSEPGTATSVDRSFATGTRYLFVPRATGGFIHDDSCSATRPYEPALDRFRPTAVRTPPVATAESTDPPAPPPPSPGAGAVPVIVLGTLAGSAALFAAVILLARRRRSS